MIRSKKELRFYIAADRMMRDHVPFPDIPAKLKETIRPDLILRYMKSMRIIAYYENNWDKYPFCYLKPDYAYHRIRFRRLGILLGFSIGVNCFGYGLLIPHYGTVIINNSVNAGNYCVLHTSICMAAGDKNIGDALYMSAGSIMTGVLTLGNNVTVAANTLVNAKVSAVSDVLLVGSPAIVKRKAEAWYIHDHYEDRINAVEQLKLNMGLF